MDYKTEPLPHQRIEFDRTCKRKNYGRLWEMGLGKTKITIDEAAFLFQLGHIEALLIFAPNGVHTAWACDELPKHCPIPFRVVNWESKKAKNKSFDKQLYELNQTVHMKVLTINHEAIMTAKCRNTVKKFLGKWKTMVVIDESHCFKTPSAKRTMRMLSFTPHADARRVLTGTPITNSPFDIYTQMKMLNKDFWKEHGLDDYTIFKHHFGVWVTQTIKDRQWEQVVAYRNLEDLQRIIEPHTSRLLKDDVLDLPPKLYTRRYFDMSAEQIRLYDELKNEFMTFLNGELITADLAIVRMQRLQQITSGYIPLDLTEKGEPAQLITDPNPRITVLNDLLSEVPHQAIIWAKYQRDVELIMESLKANKRTFVDYYGPTKTRDQNKEKFLSGEAQFFVATEAAAGTGLNLTCAKTVIYYNTTFKLHHRLQSEDRAHRVGQDRSVNYVDLIASGTIDSKILQRLVEKKEISDAVTGDDFKTWL